MLSHGVVGHATHVNVQARLCACQLQLHFFSGCKALLQVLQIIATQWWPYTEAVPAPSVPKPSVAQVRVACAPPSNPRGPIAKTRGRLNCCLQCVPTRVLGPQLTAAQRSGASAKALARA